MPIAGNNLESFRFLETCLLLYFFDDAWICPFGQQVSCQVTFLPGFGKGDFRIGAKRKFYFLVLETVFKIPEFTAGMSDKKKKAPTVKKF